MEAPPGSFWRILIALTVIALLAAGLLGYSLFSWNNDRQRVIDFACDGKITGFQPEDEYTRPVLVVTNEVGSIVSLESWALALTERDAPLGARIVKNRGEPDGKIDDRLVTFLRER